MTALASAGQALDNNAQNAALDLPPIDGSDYTSAMGDSRNFAAGVQATRN